MDTDTIFLQSDVKNNRKINSNFEHQGNEMKIIG